MKKSVVTLLAALTILLTLGRFDTVYAEDLITGDDSVSNEVLVENIELSFPGDKKSANCSLELNKSAEFPFTITYDVTEPMKEIRFELEIKNGDTVIAGNELTIVSNGADPRIKTIGREISVTHTSDEENLARGHYSHNLLLRLRVLTEATYTVNLKLVRYKTAEHSAGELSDIGFWAGTSETGGAPSGVTVSPHEVVVTIEVGSEYTGSYKYDGSLYSLFYIYIKPDDNGSIAAGISQLNTFLNGYTPNIVASGGGSFKKTTLTAVALPEPITHTKDGNEVVANAYVLAVFTSAAGKPVKDNPLTITFNFSGAGVDMALRPEMGYALYNSEGGGIGVKDPSSDTLIAGEDPGMSPSFEGKFIPGSFEVLSVTAYPKRTASNVGLTSDVDGRLQASEKTIAPNQTATFDLYVHFETSQKLSEISFAYEITKVSEANDGAFLTAGMAEPGVSAAVAGNTITFTASDVIDIGAHGYSLSLTLPELDTASRYAVRLTNAAYTFALEPVDPESSLPVATSETFTLSATDASVSVTAGVVIRILDPVLDLTPPAGANGVFNNGSKKLTVPFTVTAESCKEIQIVLSSDKLSNIRFVLLGVTQNGTALTGVSGIDNRDGTYTVTFTPRSANMTDEAFALIFIVNAGNSFAGGVTEANVFITPTVICDTPTGDEAFLRGQTTIPLVKQTLKDVI